jgi:hypothetical protein
MNGMVMSISEVKVSQVDRQGEQTLQNADRVVPINREIGQQQKRSEGAALPESCRNNTPLRPLRSNPLNQKPQTKDETAAPSNDFPKIECNAENHDLAERKMKMHNAKNVRQKHRP